MKNRLVIIFIFLAHSFLSTAQVIDNAALYRNMLSDKSIRLHYENDYFSASDLYYTQGINLEIIRIENRDAVELIKIFLKRPATLIYLDPPYFADRTKGYAIGAYDEEFHIKLLETALKAKSMIFISGYNNDLYNSLLTKRNGWSKRTIDTITKDIKGNDHQREEVVWANQHFQQASKLNQLLVRLTRRS